MAGALEAEAEREGVVFEGSLGSGPEGPQPASERAKTPSKEEMIALWRRGLRLKMRLRAMMLRQYDQKLFLSKRRLD